MQKYCLHLVDENIFLVIRCIVEASIFLVQSPEKDQRTSAIVDFGFTFRLRKEIWVMRCSFLNSIIIANLAYSTTSTIRDYLSPDIIIDSFGTK